MHAPLARIAAIILTMSTLTACVDDAESIPERPPAPPQDVIYQGLWERVGYGDVLQVDETGAALFQFTRAGCVEADRLDNNDIADLFSNPELSADATDLTTSPRDSQPFEASFAKLTALPELCLPASLTTDASPTATFEHLWHTFNDYYAFFSEREVDWNEQYATLRPRVNDELGDEELLEIFEVLLAPLDDGHVRLSTGSDEFDFTQLRGANRVIADSFSAQAEFDDVQDYANAVSQDFVRIRSSYLDEGSIDSAGGSTGRRVSWGKINQQVGFLRVARMHDLSTNGDDSAAANLTAINAIMATALADLQDTRALIIDVRTNEGGEDAVGLAIADHFADENRLAITKRARSFNGDTEATEAFIKPVADTTYLQPIAVIAASDTSSAAEVFLMAMRALPNVTLIGENSNGILSDILSKSLPNGWEVGLSNEVYTDFQDIGYEVTGVPPDIMAATFSLNAIADDKDAAIDAALEALGF